MAFYWRIVSPISPVGRVIPPYFFWRVFMQVTFLFLINSLQLLFPYDFYLIPLIFFTFVLFLHIVKSLYRLGEKR